MADENSLENQEYTPEELANMGRMYAKLVKSPKTRDGVLRATKAVAPETNIPEIDVLDKVAVAMTPHLTKMQKLEQDAIKHQVERNIETKRAELREQGFGKDEIDAVEKLMVEKQIPDYKTAGEFYRLQAQSAKPTPANWENKNKLPVNKEGFKKEGGYKNFFKQDAHQAIEDIRAGRIKLQ